MKKSKLNSQKVLVVGKICVIGEVSLVGKAGVVGEAGEQKVLMNCDDLYGS